MVTNKIKLLEHMVRFSLKQVFVLVLLFSPLHVGAQSKLYVIDFSDRFIREQIESDVESAFNQIKRSFNQNTKPNWAGVLNISESFKSDIGKIWETSRIRIDEDTLFRPALTLSGGNFEIRDIPITLVTRDTLYFEDAVLTFNSSGKLLNFMIGLPQHRYMQYIYEATEEIDKSRRQTILNFVEQYRTAYNTKNLTLIEQVFSDQALIVVGNVIRTSTESNQYNEIIQYLKLTKNEYVRRLGNIFRSNNFVNLNFDDISILRHPKHPSVYGISFVQSFRSTTYTDDGYVFLLIDFRKDEQNPTIHVRTWQPVRDTPRDRVFQLGDIEIY